MANSVLLQKAQIIKVDNDKIYVKHPDLSTHIRTHLTARVAAAGTTLTVLDNDGFNDDDFLILGYPGDSQTEEIDVNGAVTRGTSLTVTNTLKFAHEVDSPVTLIYARKIRIMGASTLTGSQTEITGSPFDIQWDKPETECVLTLGNTNYAYYFAEFTDAAGSPVYGTQSDGVASSGLTSATAEKIIANGLRLTGEKISTEPDGLLTRESLIEELNNWQEDVASRRDWSHETFNDSLNTSEGVRDYNFSDLTTTLKRTDSNKSIISLKLGKNKLKYIDWETWLRRVEGDIENKLNGATAIGATSITLDDSSEFADSGSISVGSDTGVTYTANSGTVLSGIPASGTGSLAATHADDDPVWQNVSYSRPIEYTVYNGQILLVKPIDSTHAGINLLLRGYQQITRLTDLSDTTAIPFYYVAQYYLAARIEYLKGNHDRGDKWMVLYEQKIEREVRKDRQPNTKRVRPIGDDTLQTGRGKFYRSTESSKYNYS